MIALLNWRVWAAVALASVLALTHFSAYRSGKAHVQTAWDAQKLVQITAAKEADIENRRIENKRQSVVFEAQKNNSARMAILRADAIHAGNQSSRLRDTIATLTANLPSRAPTAVGEYATTSGQLLGECGAAYTDLAAKTDGHASDSLMLQQAWPK